MTRTYRLILTAVTALACSSVAACSASVSVGNDKVPAGKLEKAITSKLASSTELKNPVVTCPKNEKNEKGNSFVCTFDSDNGVTGDVDVKVTNDSGHADFKTDPTSFKLKGSVVADAVEADFKSKYPGQAAQLASVDCGETISDTPNTSGTCTISSSDGQSADLTIKIDENGHASWDFTEISGG